ncbi:hypothetical protein KKB18_10110 [bacterium]|nr:hypothetical protein [bacterium]
MQENSEEKNSEELGLWKEIFILMKEKKKWWILPIVIVIGFLCLFILLTGGQTALLPWIYANF